MIEGKDREETIRLTAEGLGIPLSEAAFMYAMEHGEIPPTGDVRADPAAVEGTSDWVDDVVVAIGPDGEWTELPGGTPELTPELIAEILARPDE